MPKVREKIERGKEKLSTKLKTGKEKIKAGGVKLKLKVKAVGSKLREEGPRGARRGVWLLVAAILYYHGWSVYAICQLFLGMAALLFIGLPFVFKYTPAVQRNMVFLPFVRMPKNINFSSPDEEGLPGVRNFYLESEPGVSVGVWHILPQSSVDESAGKDLDWWETALGDSRSVVLYLHGNTGHRALPHRKELYQLLRSMDYHVVAFDYRGYADSMSHLSPTETGVVRDARAVYDYVFDRVKNSKLLVWGHSLGTAVSAHLVADLCQQAKRPCGLVLESPFNNIFDEVRNHPLAWAWRKMPWFDWFFSAPLAANDVGFVTDQRVEVIDVPILMFHAEDDLVVPFKLGRALYESAVEKRDPSWPGVTWQGFEGHHGYSHKFICRAPEVMNIFRSFETKCRENTAVDESETDLENFTVEESETDLDNVTVDESETDHEERS